MNIIRKNPESFLILTVSLKKKAVGNLKLIHLNTGNERDMLTAVETAIFSYS